MRSIFLIAFAIFFTLNINAQHQEDAPGKQAQNLPIWVQLMYSEDANPDEVREAYTAFYENNPFVKNGHTQYYKHWLRNLSRDVDGTFSGAVSWAQAKIDNAKYLQKRTIAKNAGPNSNWECIGPYDWDHDANERSYAPGAAHVYTVEQAPSNGNTLYAGTATAGLFKTTDNGASWNSLTTDLMVNGIRSIEIDPNNENIVFFESGGSVYKTSNGGSTWNVIGDAIFQSTAHSVNDMVAFPNSSSIYFICATDGLWRTADGGNNWTKILGGDWQELEFQPGNANQVYAIKENGNHTEFYKSLDAGLTWNIKPTGWPGLAGSSGSTTFDAVNSGSGTGDYTNFSNIGLGDATIPDFTIELRIKSNGWSGDPAIISNKNWGSGYWRGFVLAGNTNGSTWKFNIGDGSNRIDLNGSTINDGLWHHIVITYDFDGTKAVYQDGSLINSTTTNITHDVLNAANDLNIGQDGTNSYPDGIGMEVSDVRIWNTALGNSTIENWYCQTLDNTHPSYVNLIHHWKMDDGSGTTVTDAIGTNNGATQGTSNWTSSNNMTCISVDLAAGEEQRRTEIAVSDDDANVVYALSTGEVNGGSGLFGIYKSMDGGETWSFDCCGPQPGGPAQAGTNINTMGWQDDGSDDGGQYYYDLALNVDPTDADKVHIGGVNHWVSTDGGTTFTCPSKWSHPHKSEYVHADIHDIRFYGNELWVACDGGLFYSTDGSTFTRRMTGIEGTDFWGFGGGFNNGEVLVGGTYHNGTLLKDNSTYVNDWLSTQGGDNYRGFVNPANATIVYHDGGKKVLSGNRSQNFQHISFAIQPNATFVVGESSNIEFDPRNPNVAYSGVGTAIWKTENDGETGAMIHDFGSGNSVGEIRIAWSNPDVIYAATFGGTDKIWKTTDGGTTWSQLATPGGSSVPFSISVSATDENTIWAARTVSWTWQGTLDGNKVFKSTNGGGSWSNITGTALNGEYITNILHHKGSTNGGVYVATRKTVYYKNDNLSDFAFFGNNLPASTNSTRLIANYGGEKMYNGTNRSVYKVDFYETAPPVAQISADVTNVLCTGDLVNFYSNSIAQNGASYNWSFPTGTPSSSSDKNPLVSFNSLGNHDVSLTVTDANGTNTQTYTNFITVGNNCNPETVPGMALQLNGSTDYASIDQPDYTTNNWTVSAWIKRDGDQNTNAGIVFTRPSDGASGINFGSNNELEYHWQGSASYNWQSGLFVPDNEWTHIALVVTPSNATIYMNGVPSVRTLSHDTHNFNANMYIGYDPNSSSRRYKGLIDEVAIFDRALTMQEIRELRHLTQSTGDPNFKQYYQFNEANGDVFNRIGGGLHATLQGSAGRTTSTSPIGGGTSATVDCSTGGVKNFNNVDLSIEFPTSGTYPNGNVVVSRLDLQPDQLPNAFPSSASYWIINNYGTNATFSELTNIVFENIGNVPSDATASEYKLYKRNSNEEGNSWGNSIDFGDNLITGSAGIVTFEADNGINSFSQFIVTRESAVLPIDLLQFSVHLNAEKTVEIDWATASEVQNDYFLVEKSKNGINFSEIDRVEAVGNSTAIQNYKTIDAHPFIGTSFYRLKQVDEDGKFSYSEIKSITLDALESPIVVYPNPIGKSQELRIESEFDSDLILTVYSSSGKKLFIETIFNGNGFIRLVDVPTGAYWYQIKSERFLKNGVLIVE